MTLWRSLKTEVKPVRNFHIEDGYLTVFRSKGAISRIIIDDVALVQLRVIHDQLFWYLQDRAGAFVLIAESVPEIGVLRRYLSAWRGFNYDGLVRFDQTRDTNLQLWPIARPKVA